jgi:hypothetical protein
MLQRIYRLQPDSVGDEKGGIRANHSTKASDDAARVPFKEPRNRFPAWRAGKVTLIVVPAPRPHGLSESIPGHQKSYKYRLM